MIPGYNGIATVDEKHQIIVDAQAFGDAHEARHVEDVVDSIEKTFKGLDKNLDIYKEVVFTADSGFNSEAATAAVLDRKIDAYIADTGFRKRDPRFSNQQGYRAKSIDRRGTSKTRKYFSTADFHFSDKGDLICPARKPMELTKRYTYPKKGYTGLEYYGNERNCTGCSLRSKCIRGKKSVVRRIKIMDGANTAVQRMIERFDTDRGRHYYSRRMGTVEPVFANIRRNMGLDWFSVRGRVKVDTQWKLFALVHNIGKLAVHGSLEPAPAARRRR